jgi:predicted nucleic acid-binding Zn ribbon protein
MDLQNEQICENCGKKLTGRIDKRFCDDVCRNIFHNQQKTDEATFIKPINAILRKNRRVLITLNTNGKTKVHKDALQKAGFNFAYYTHQFTTKKGSTYIFCYEQGYLSLDNDWYMLVVNQRA